MADLMTIEQVRDFLRGCDSLGTPNSYNCFQMAHAIDAHLSKQRKSEPVVVEAVGTIGRNDEGEFGIDWTLEGGICGLEEGCVLLVADGLNELVEAEGYTEVFTDPHAPAQVTDDELIAIARRVGLRESMHGVHTSVAKDLLRKFMVAVMSEDAMSIGHATVKV